MRNNQRALFGYGKKYDGQIGAKAEYASKRPNGTINTHPQERMRASGNRDEDE